MSRNLVVCLDGTDDQFDASNSNVVKLYQMLQRNTPEQLTYYQTGIGTIAPVGVISAARRRILKLLDAAMGLFIKDHVLSAYRFLMQFYQKGDSVFIFGFSRGAYSARVLAGMLHKVGLLSAGNDELVDFAWRIYKRSLNNKLALEFKPTFSRPVNVYFLGLWDTVSSVGWIWNPKHFPYTAENPGVQAVRHAVSLDEQRAQFVQNLWKQSDGQDFKEIWFPGVHCDIGGGYHELDAGLSKITLKWMVEEVENHGLKIDTDAKVARLPLMSTETTSAPDPLAKMHQSLRGFWWISEVIPKPFHDPRHGYRRRWMMHFGRHRYVHTEAQIHRSVHERMDDDPSYNPPNLPTDPNVT